MKRTILVVASIVVATFFTNAQIFWKITKPGSDKTSYLLGTHHLFEKEKIPGSEKILSHIADVELVVGEMKMDNMLSKQLKMLQAAIMKDSTISQLLTEEEYKLVDTQMKEVVGKGLDKMGKLKPAMLSSLYSVMLYMKENKLSKEPEVLDMEVQKIAKKNKIEIIGLETVDQQIDILFNSRPLNYQAKQLVEAVKDKENSLENVRKMNEIYLTGNINEFIDLTKADGQMDELDMDILNYNRNSSWLSQLKDCIQQKSCFIAVGCLHLVGEKGLIQLIRKGGYSVEPVD